MDPIAAMAEVVTLMCAGDFDAAQERLDDIRAWSNRGGFLPQDPSLIADALSGE